MQCDDGREKKGTSVPNRNQPNRQAIPTRIPCRFTEILVAVVVLLLAFLSGCSLFRNAPPVPGASVSPSSGHAPLVVSFDGSPSYDPDGIIVDYVWKFADGQILTGECPEYTFLNPGQQTVTLAVTDDHGQISEESLIVDVDPPNDLPVPRITVSPQPAYAGQDIEFSAAGSTDDGAICRFSWSFGDGAAAQGEVVIHRYDRSGTFPVTLVILDDDGASAETTATVDVRSSADEPGMFIAAQISSSSGSADVGALLTFDGTASTSSMGDIVRYVWTFGDGATAEGSIVTHRYMRADQFTVRLVVADVSGAYATTEVEVQISQPDGDTTAETPATDWGDASMVITYDWVADTQRRSVSIEIPVGLYEEYAARTRCVAVYGSYDQYVLDPLDDPLMIELAALLSATVAGAAYYDVVDNALAFVQTIITYAPDPGGVEYPRYPVESLVERIGDCEDSSILYASLLRTLGHGALIAGVDTSGSGVANHMVAFVPVGEDFADRLAQEGHDSEGLWIIGGRVYALAETAVDGSTLPLGVDPWGLEEGDIHQVWDVARATLFPQVVRYTP